MPTLADMFREDGKREGKKEAKRELNMIVVNLLKAGLDIQTIQECTKLSYNAIKSLSKHETLSTH